MKTKQELSFEAKAAYEIARRNWLDKGIEFYPAYLNALNSWVQAGFDLWNEIEAKENGKQS